MKCWFLIIVFISFYCFSQKVNIENGRSLHFDGVDDSGTIPNILTPDFTIEICIKTSVESAKGVFAYHGSGLFDADIPNDANDFALALVNDNISFHDGDGGQNANGKTKLNDGKWHQISLSRKSGGEFIIYIDGKFETRGKAGKKAPNKSPVIYLGTNHLYYSYTAIDVDEIRIWNRVLEEDEIKNNLFHELPSGQQGLLAYYPIDKNDDLKKDRITDKSGNGHHGSLFNFKSQKVRSEGAIPVGKVAWRYPIYTSPTFLISVALSVIILIFIVVRVRISLLKRENQKLEKIVSERTQEILSSLKAKEELLAEKDVLLQEVHHRIKNNLQQISTMVEMQIQNVREEAGINALKDAHRRISSMSLIHEMLYTVENVSLINTSDFIGDLIAKHIQSFNYLGNNVLFHTEIESHHLKPNDAISIGMLISETISNCYKHAFNGISDPTIWVVLKRMDQEQFVLSIRDNGIGFKDEKDLDTHKSFGMRLIGIFAKKLNGELRFDITSQGVSVEVTFTIN